MIAEGAFKNPANGGPHIFEVGKPLWEVPSNCPQEYLDMLDSESRSYDKGRWSWKPIGDRPNHYLDCEAMQICGAIMLKLVGSECVSE
ncbi:MAG: phage terminase large subunit family protein [Akkermansia sp.]|nr:phage terminase large subunit family protein [Akkermansia sp.]